MAAYNPSDSLQSKFLAAIALGESGNSPIAYNLGVGGTDLTNVPRNNYGFPVWSGIDLDTWKPRTSSDTGQYSRAAGAFQFVPGTWEAVAKEHNLDFRNPVDQNAGAWYNAQREYKENTGGDLYADLSAGNYQKIENALGDEWTSVGGNAAAPGGLANSLAQGLGAGSILRNPDGSDNLLGKIWGGPGTAAYDAAKASGDGGLIGNIFVRAALVILGGIILIASIWHLLASADVVPSAGEVAGAVVTKGLI